MHMNTISCIFKIHFKVCVYLHFHKLAGIFFLLLFVCQKKVHVVLWILQNHTFSPGGPIAPWGPGSPCGQKGETKKFSEYTFWWMSSKKKNSFHFRPLVLSTDLSTRVALLSRRSWLTLRSLKDFFGFFRNLITNTRIDYSIYLSKMPCVNAGEWFVAPYSLLKMKYCCEQT